MKSAANSPVPLPIVLAFAGFMLSLLFPGKLHPLSATGAGFLLGIVIVRIIEQLHQEFTPVHAPDERPITKSLQLHETAKHRS